jgi:hypothetical protein
MEKGRLVRPFPRKKADATSLSGDVLSPLLFILLAKAA